MNLIKYFYLKLNNPHPPGGDYGIRTFYYQRIVT